jgi:hypothetical protein
MWGTRERKYDRLSQNTIQSIELARCEPRNPYYLFLPKDSSGSPDWGEGIPLNEVFPRYSTGTETGFDLLMMDFEASDLRKKIRLFTDPTKPRQSVKSDWDIHGGHAEFLLNNRHSFDVEHMNRYVRSFQFRAFDYRSAYLKKDLLKTNSFNVMEHLSVETPGIVATRQTKERFGIFVVSGFCGHKCISGYDRSYVFPGWTGPSGGGLLPARACLMSAAFLSRARAVMNAAVPAFHPNERDIFHYIVALLSAPNYEDRYRENLKRDFPRVFLTADRSLFCTLIQVGADLTALYLLESEYRYASWNLKQSITKNPLESKPVLMRGSERAEVTSAYPRRDGQRVYINSTSWLDGVDDAVWEAYIGAFQVCEKWLKDRRGRCLSGADLEHYSRIVNAVREIVRLRREIDSAIRAAGGWPFSGSTEH